MAITLLPGESVQIRVNGMIKIITSKPYLKHLSTVAGWFQDEVISHLVAARRPHVHRHPLPSNPVYLMILRSIVSFRLYQ